MIKDDEVINKYCDKLDTALKNRLVNNIALTGWHGSGKSTIIKNFTEGRMKRNQYLIISLLPLVDDKISYMKKSNITMNKEKNVGEIDSVENKEVTASKNNSTVEEEPNDGIITGTEFDLVANIEKSILRQIMYKNSIDEMPYSDIKRLHGNKTMTYGTIIFIISCILLFLSLFSNCFVNLNILLFEFIQPFLANHAFVNFLYWLLVVIYIVFLSN